MKPLRTFPCKCGRGPAVSRCEAIGMAPQWCCHLCANAFWTAVYARWEAA